MPSLYNVPHPYHMNHQRSQRYRQCNDTTYSQEPGASSNYPIVIPPSPSGGVINNNNYSWNTQDCSLEAFAWPSLWFDVPSITPPASSSQLAPQTFDMLDSLPDLIRSDTRTPEASPASSLRDACTTPAQENTTVVAVCDVPVVAPRPLPFTPPAFLQFDCLPDEDEDLSFPPYTHSRRHLCDSKQQIQNPRKRPAPPPNTPVTTSEIETVSAAGITSLSSISKKRRRLTHGENAAPALSLVPAQPAGFISNSGVPYLNPQLAHFTRDGMVGWI